MDSETHVHEQRPRPGALYRPELAERVPEDVLRRLRRQRLQANELLRQERAVAVCRLEHEEQAREQSNQHREYTPLTSRRLGVEESKRNRRSGRLQEHLGTQNKHLSDIRHPEVHGAADALQRLQVRHPSLRLHDAPDGAVRLSVRSNNKGSRTCGCRPTSTPSTS